jgi:hypothetical protein
MSHVRACSMYPQFSRLVQRRQYPDRNIHDSESEVHFPHHDPLTHTLETRNSQPPHTHSTHLPQWGAEQLDHDHHQPQRGSLPTHDHTVLCRHRRPFSFRCVLVGFFVCPIWTPPRLLPREGRSQRTTVTVALSLSLTHSLTHYLTISLSRSLSLSRCLSGCRAAPRAAPRAPSRAPATRAPAAVSWPLPTRLLRDLSLCLYVGLPVRRCPHPAPQNMCCDRRRCALDR